MKRLLLLLILLVSPAHADDALVQKLQEISVTIGAGGSQGSGVLFTRKEGEQTVTYCWTAAHVIDSLRKQREAVVNGAEKKVIEFGDAQIVQEFRENGRRIGEQKMDARVVRYSDAEHGEDLAILEVRKRNFVPAETTVKFYKGDIPPIGTELYHVGSLLGQFGSNSLTVGVVSQIGRVIDDLGANGVLFDQTTCTAFPGSSGGGVFLKDSGEYVGMLVRGSGEQFNLTVPIRRMRAWAKEAKVEWAMDASVPLPSPEELKAMPVEDAGVTFQPLRSSGADLQEFPFLIRKNHEDVTP